MTTQNLIRILSAGLTVAVAAGHLRAADETAEKREVRVFVSKDGSAPVEQRTSHIVVKTDGEDEAPTEPYAFLGVETARASSTLHEQLGLPRGIGLVVQRVVDGAPAAETLKKHDILTKLDDQLLVSPDQLGVLVRSKNPGDEVTLTFLRGGREQSATVKLGERRPAAPRVWEFRGTGGDFGGLHEDKGELLEKLKGLRGNISPEEVNRMMDALREERRETGGAPGFQWHDGQSGAVVHMLNVGRGNVVFSDENGVVELMSGPEGKHLLVKDEHGKVTFEGPVGTEEERAKLSEPVRARLQKVENIRTIETVPGAELERSELRVLGTGEESAAREIAPQPVAWVASGAGQQ